MRTSRYVKHQTPLPLFVRLSERSHSDSEGLITVEGDIACLMAAKAALDTDRA